MILAKEITVWNSDFQPNHTYLLSDSMDKCYGYFKWNNPKEFQMFKRGGWFDTRYRKFKILQRDLKLAGQESTNRRWKLNGSKDHVYYVEETETGMTCTCIGYKYHGKCKHIEQVTNELQSIL
jgi:hypothetical protein